MSFWCSWKSINLKTKVNCRSPKKNLSKFTLNLKRAINWNTTMLMKFCCIFSPSKVYMRKSLTTVVKANSHKSRSTTWQRHYCQCRSNKVVVTTRHWKNQAWLVSKQQIIRLVNWLKRLKLWLWIRVVRLACSTLISSMLRFKSRTKLVKICLSPCMTQYSKTPPQKSVLNSSRRPSSEAR